jgi:ligand-binding sensor domain-containing protein
MRHMTIIVLALIVLTTACERDVAQGQWTTYTTNDEVAGYLVTSIAVHPNGDVWVGTYLGGVLRFDGETWSTYTEETGLADDWVTSIAIDSEGIVWLAFEQSPFVSSFDGHTWSTHTGPPATCPAIEAGKAVVAVSDGILLGSPRGCGIQHYDGETWTTFAQRQAFGLFATPDDDIWVIRPMAGGHGSLSRCDVTEWFDGKTWTQHDLGCVQSITMGPDGSLWFGTWDGVIRFDGEMWTTYTEEDGLVSNKVFAVAVDSDGATWCGTRDGISRFDGRNWSTLTTDDGQTAPGATVIAVDLDGSLWFGMEENIVHYRPPD